MYQNSSNAYKIYQQNNVNTASSHKLLLMLYEGAIKFCRFAEIAMDEKNIEKKNYYFIRVQDIITELMVTLNHDTGEIANNLNIIYDFMCSELIQSNIKNDKEKLIMVKEMLEELKDTWSSVMK